MKKIIKVNSNNEYLSNDILDEQFIKSIRLLNSFQRLMASSRVEVKHRFVVLPSFIQRCYTVLSILILLWLDYIIVDKCNLVIFDSETVYYLCTCVTVLQSVAYLCNIIHVRFFNWDANIEFYVKLQHIERCMKIDRNKSVTALMIRIQIMSLAGVTIIFIVLVAVACSKGNDSFWPFLGIVYCQLCFVVELVSCSNIFLYFFLRVRFMNAIIKNFIDNKKVQSFFDKKCNIVSTLLPTKMYMRRLAARTHNFASSETDVYVKEILDGFGKFQYIYQFQIFVFCCKLIASCLITFEFLLFTVQTEEMELWDSLTPSLFTIIDLLMAIMLGILCEVLIREVKETKRLAICVMSMHYDGRLRDKSKRMLKLIDETPLRFSVYEMWKLDANIMLQMFMLVTGLVVTQLQFTLL